MSFRFLLDVNIGLSLQNWLANQGHDVIRVSDRDPRMPDKEVAQWATEENRIIVTTDMDFEQKVHLEQWQHRGILRLENLPRPARLRLVADVLARFSEDLREGCIVIAQRSKVRVRHPR